MKKDSAILDAAEAFADLAADYLATSEAYREELKVSSRQIDEFFQRARERVKNESREA